MRRSRNDHDNSFFGFCSDAARGMRVFQRPKIARAWQVRAAIASVESEAGRVERFSAMIPVLPQRYASVPSNDPANRSSTQNVQKKSPYHG